ncbi:uncharacterized protein PHACADRAFT_246999 [Phanerochaete carnosa HHB-10118-sp]|uniref:C2H2-type domain-containing protein n=1 Tax=Phanerochaete carnosa (strain HHB-10118-sp) TaxID=650164 RepID=K5WA91_PHACS|nr:uncharacterized protein PHACADRAFT_246999 [Phanerochaete carnosa HHB-10118-sp]EKM60828.1 hypothetical protein PHACADRAFT_246999 [Phanerochaete carnosa HHB-10118-sp]
MSEYFYHPIAPPQSAAYDYSQLFDNAAPDFAPPQPKQSLRQQPLDFDFQPFVATDGYNPHIHTVEAFDNDLDTSLATWNIDAELSLVPTDNSDLFRRIRTGTPRGGPSTIHSESASGYDTNYAESSYDPAYGSTYDSVYNQSEVSALSGDLDMKLQAFGLRDERAYGSSPISPNSSVSLNQAAYSPPSYHRGSFSDYEPQTGMRAPASSASDYYPHSMGVKYPSSVVVQATVSPANVSAQLPSHSTPSPVVASQRLVKQESMSKDMNSKDPKRKYQCPTCPRAFARAFNLKTHIQTHDPNRAKPYTCHHKTCGRSFSRKHDLTRHLVSIHRSEAEENVKNGKAIGVGAGSRVRCDICGTSWADNGKNKGCECDDVK